MKYPDDYINKIICGDCLEVMKTFPDDCIDTIITDPPYGIGFMGKEWDNFKASFIENQQKKNNGDYLQNIKQKQQKYPNLKGRKLSPIGNRSSISGSYDLSPKGLIGFQEWVEVWATEALRVAKPGSTLLCFGGTRTYHRLACAIEDAGWIIKDCIMWLYGSGFPKATDIGKQIDKLQGNEREDLGKHPNARKTVGNINICKKNGSGRLTKGNTEWEGYKSHGLKPAYEPILLCMKPNEGSYANNALKWGVAGLNIDGGRIGTEKLSYTSTFKRMINKNIEQGYRPITMQGSGGEVNKTVKGRFPANIILDEEAARLLDEQAPMTGAFAKVKSGHSGKSKGIYHDYAQRGDDGETFYNDGLRGASRFFYCAKASKAERNRGCEGLEGKKMPHNTNMKCAICGLPILSGTGETCKCINKQEIRKTQQNHHPTVKPLALMKYLVTLTKMPNSNQVYLDPFCGSGTTLMACKESKRNYIGIEKDSEYCEIARRRMKAIPELLF